MEQNKVELIGRINWSNISYKDSGSTIVKFLVSKKIRENDYVSFPVTMFNEAGQKAFDLLQKGDYGHFVGKLSMSIYVVDEQKKEKMEFLAFEADKVTFDADKKQFVLAEGKEEEELPWS